MAFVANVAIEGLSLPEAASAAQHLVAPVGREALPGVSNGTHSKSLLWREQHVDVIRHHAPAVQSVTLSVKIQQCILHNFCQPVVL